MKLRVGLVLLSTLSVLMGVDSAFSSSCFDLFRNKVERRKYFDPAVLEEKPSYTAAEIRELLARDPRAALGAIENIFAENERLRKKARSALRNPLTGLYNRRAFDEIVPRVFSHAEKENYPVTILSIDANKFKLINDLISHTQGDRHLKDIANLLVLVVTKTRMRDSDLVFQNGGDEFHVVLQGTDLVGATIVAQRIILEVERSPFMYDLAKEIFRSASHGGLATRQSVIALTKSLGHDWPKQVAQKRVGSLMIGIAERSYRNGHWETPHETKEVADADLERQKLFR